MQASERVLGTDEVPREGRGLQLRGPNWGLFWPEIRAFTGFGARFLQRFPKSLATVKYYSNTKTVNGEIVL